MARTPPSSGKPRTPPSWVLCDSLRQHWRESGMSRRVALPLRQQILRRISHYGALSQKSQMSPGKLLIGRNFMMSVLVWPSMMAGSPVKKPSAWPMNRASRAGSILIHLRMLMTPSAPTVGNLTVRRRHPVCRRYRVTVAMYGCIILALNRGGR